MRMYLAAPFERQDELRGYASELEAAGHVITARWLHENETAGMNMARHLLQKYAKTDLEDIDSSDMVLFFTPDGPVRGGVHVEFGYAVSQKKTVAVIGPRATIFHYLPQVLWFDTWAKARTAFGIYP